MFRTASSSIHRPKTNRYPPGYPPFSARSAISGRLNGNAQVQQGLRVNPVSFMESETVPAVNGGGGFRLYLTGNGRFGIRLEAKIYKPLSGDIVGTAPFGKVSLGVFYQFQ